MSKTQKTEVTETTPNTENAVSMELFQQMQEMMKIQQETIARLEANQTASKASGDDDIVDTERKPAGNILIATIDGMPITDMRLEKLTKINDAGQTVIVGLQAICQVHGQDKPVKITYGDRDNPTDYLNLPRVRFDLVDQADESGASKIERGKVIRTDGLVAEKQEVNNQLVPTGRKVQLALREDFRHYTIEVDGEKVVLAQDKIYR